MSQAATAETTTQRGPAASNGGGQASANVSVDQLATMLRRKPAPAGEAAGEGSSSVNRADRNGSKQAGKDGKAGGGNGNGKTGKAATTTKAPVSAGEEAAGSSSDGSTDLGSGISDRRSEGGDLNAEDAEISRSSAEGEEIEGAAAEGADTIQSADAAEGADSEGEGTEGNEGNEGAEGETPANVPKAIKSMRKRINTLTRQLREAEAIVAETRELNERGPSPQPSPQGEGGALVDPRFAGDSTLKKVLGDLQTAEAVGDWAEEALDQLAASGEEAVEFQGRKLGKAELRKIARNSQATRSELAGQKAARVQRLEQEFQNSLAQHNAAAVKAYPWMADETSDEFQRATAILKKYKDVLAVPNRALIVGDLVAGQMAREAREKSASQRVNGSVSGNSNGARGDARPPSGTKAKPAPLPSGGGVGAVRVDGRATKVKEAEALLEKSGRARDLVKLLRVKREAALATD